MDFIDPNNSDDVCSPDARRLIALLAKTLKPEVIADLRNGDFTRGYLEDGVHTIIDEHDRLIGVVSPEIDEAVGYWYVCRRTALEGDDRDLIGRLFIHTRERKPVSAAEVTAILSAGDTWAALPEAQ